MTAVGLIDHFGKSRDLTYRYTKSALDQIFYNRNNFDIISRHSIWQLFSIEYAICQVFLYIIGDMAYKCLYIGPFVLQHGIMDIDKHTVTIYTIERVSL